MEASPRVVMTRCREAADQFLGRYLACRDCIFWCDYELCLDRHRTANISPSTMMMMMIIMLR